MDAPGLPPGEVADAYRVLRRVNRQLGNLRTIRLEVARFLREIPHPGGALSALDVGSGSGDIGEHLAGQLGGRGPQPRALVMSLDRDATAARLAHASALPVIRGDALRLPFADRSVDLVTAVKFAHHFQGPELDRLIHEMSRVARHRVIVLDIRRHWAAYLGFVAWSRVFTRNRFVRHDGPLSVLRGFTGDELASLGRARPEFAWQVRSYLGFQLALVGQRIATPQPPGSARPGPSPAGRHAHDATV